MKASTTIRLIAARELRERVVKRGYLLGTLATLVIVVAAIVLPSVLGGDGPDELDLGVVGAAPTGLAQQLTAALPGDTRLTVSPIASRELATASLEDGEFDAVLVDGRELLADGMPDASLRASLEGVLAMDAIVGDLGAAGLSEQQITEALQAPSPLAVVDIGGEDVGSRFIIASAVTILLLIGVQLSGGILLASAIEEKSGRVVEVLVSTARPWQLLTAKVAATSLMSFGQIALIVAVGLGTNAVFDTFPLPEATGSVIAVSAVMLVAGFLFYAALFTVAGTMAPTLEDAQQTVGPLYLLLFGGYGAVFAAVLPSPDGIVSRVLTFLPPTAPFIVPARLALDAISWPQVAIAIAITLLGALVTIRLAGRIYAASLLAGGKLTWRGALKAEPVR